MKYLGGKQRLGKHLAPTLHDIWNDHPELNGYLEPFCGSLGVFKHMTELPRARTIVANDYHPNLLEGITRRHLHLPRIHQRRGVSRRQRPSVSQRIQSICGVRHELRRTLLRAYSQKYLGTKKEDFCKEMTNSLKRIAPLLKKKKIKFTNKCYQDLKPSNKLIYCDPTKTKYPIKYRRGSQELRHLSGISSANGRRTTS